MSAQEDRRAAPGQRIPFEGIVELGGEAASGGGFEAQGVDVSTGGMHLRTAYLPDVGQPLLCRFDGGGLEVQAEGDVMWRREGSRGGEFGIRFTNIDGPGAEALVDACGVRPSSAAESTEAPAQKTTPGTRVRLHIEGLGSPMKARVRDASHGELMVGSNLEFLRVGRPLELEDVDHKGQKRAAHIDRVEVEVDPNSRVPQLVVALRFDDVPVEATEAVERTPGPVTMGSASSVAPVSVDPMNDDEVQMAGQMKSKLAQAATKVGPAVGRLGARARTTLGLLVAKAKERSGKETQARRMTAPPPAGALHAQGKRVVREEADSDEASVADASRAKRRRAIAYGGATAGAALLVGLIARSSPSAPPGATAAHVAEGNSSATDALAAAAPEQPAPPAAAPANGVQANVPLFGPTTLSTTEAVAPPAPAAAAPGLAAPSGALAMAPGASPPDTAESNETTSADDSADDERKPSSKREHKVAPFIHGKVVHPNVLHVHTDGTITAMHAARTATGFTVTLPGRHAEGASSLGAKDPRIASAHVSNGSKGAELTFQFKDGVPAYAVRAKGHDLQIALGRPSVDGEEPTHGSTAKKHAASKDKEETPHKKK